VNDTVHYKIVADCTLGHRPLYSSGTDLAMILPTTQRPANKWSVFGLLSLAETKEESSVNQVELNNTWTSDNVVKRFMKTLLKL
jgi:hypothetical protein